jgi:NAD(P)-dependent dehydrogenase (short-subunit alcohol dehydrogenase family)
MNTSTDLTGKVAVVTGAGQGIGLACAKALVAAGAKVVVSDINLANASAVADQFGTAALALHADVSSGSDVTAMVEKAISAFGGIDILVNNAGIDEAVSILDMTEEQWDRLIGINLKGVFLTTKAVLPSMIERGGGSVVSMGSIVARQGAMNGGIHYAASKGGILAFTKTLARQMASKGIRANAVAPGVVDTELIRTHMAPDVRTKVEAAIPFGRLAQTDEIGSVVAFLASDAASYITGATIDVNGGFWIG